MPFSKKYYIVLLLASVTVILLLYFAFVPFADLVADDYHYVFKKTPPVTIVSIAPVTSIIPAPEVAQAPPQIPKHLENPPAVIKAIYLTGWSAGSKKYRTYLQSLLDTTQINAVVIDVKDSAGIISYQSQIADTTDFVQQLHARGIYVIGRIAVFEDPVLAKRRPDLAVYDIAKTKEAGTPIPWRDNNGSSWLDPASKEVLDYNMAIARQATDFGFDEINFDYVRFPTDGNLENMGFPFWDQTTAKSVVIKNFFQNVRQALGNTTLSADLFGQTTSSTDDMGIGQIFEDALDYFDYVCPMVYPSHYAKGFLGYQNPAEYPYQVINYELNEAVIKRQAYGQANDQGSLSSLAKIRPWLQDFNLGATYDAPMVTSEIKATQDSTGQDFSGYLLWNPSNIYTKDALLLQQVAPN